MRRRELIKVIGGAAAWPITAHAQQGERMRRIGVMMGYAETDPAAQAQVAALRQELQKLGWDEGRNIRIDVRFPCGGYRPGTRHPHGVDEPHTGRVGLQHQFGDGGCSGGSPHHTDCFHKCRRPGRFRFCQQ